VILDQDLRERGVGSGGRGCPAYVGIVLYGEGAAPAVADLDLDGQEEVIAGSHVYDADGRTLWTTAAPSDGAAAVANLDGDPEGEFVWHSYNQVAGIDTDGSLLWGPLKHRSANILAPPAIGDLDNDGEPEIVTAGGGELWVLDADGSTLWTARVQDESGATGASLFDFDADGTLEVVYIDEVQMIAFNGADGAIKFQTDKHRSATMYDYPVIADVDGDDHAEIVIAHDAYSAGITVYEDSEDSWAPARKTWNQHQYSINNINDDLTVPKEPTPNFTTLNSWHSQQPLPGGQSLGSDLEAEIVSICTDDCDRGTLLVTGRGRNVKDISVPAGLKFALYARTDGGDRILAVQETESETPGLMTTEALTFEVKRESLDGATALWLVVDDNGNGTGAWTECVEENNGAILDGPFCP
jgi:hypothetical protein